MITLLLHAVFSTAIAYLFAWTYGSLTPFIAIASLLLGAWLARSRARELVQLQPGLKTFEFSRGEAGTIEAIVAALAVYFCFRHFAWLLVYVDSRYMTLNPNNFGDLPLHINYIREMASGVSFPPANPSFASEILRYPFGADLYSALWESIGTPISTHLFLVGLAATVLTVITLRSFGGWWALGGFFFSGGVIGWSVWTGQEAAVDLSQGVDWKNLTLAVFITQRGFLFALPLGLILIEATRRHFSDDSVLSKKAMTTLGICWGVLPLFHAHAFVVVSLIMAGIAMIESGSVKALWQLLTSRLAIVAYIPALIFVFRTSDGFGKARIIHWDSFWTTTLAELPGFLVLNFGAWLLLPIALLVTLVFSRRLSKVERRKYLLLFALYAGLFCLFFNVMLAPWAWDNIKLLIFPYLGFCHLAWRVIDPILPPATRIIIAGVLFSSGVTAVMLSINNPSIKGVTLYQGSNIFKAEGALSGVPAWAVFASATTHEHPLTYFGRLRAVGYEGHLWSHAIDYMKPMAKLKELMTGTSSDPLKLARELGVTHIFWSQAEIIQFGKEPQWPASFRNVSRVPGYSVYEVR